MEKLMRNEAMWHLCEEIFRYLNYETLEKCRMVSKLWNDVLERLALVKYLDEFGYKVAEFHRSDKKDTEMKVLTIISGWKKAVQKYDRQASIEDLRELKNLLRKLLNYHGICFTHPVISAIKIGSMKLLEFLFCTSYDVDERGYGGTKPLHLACREGSPRIAKWILNLSKKDKILQLNYRHKDGMTPFHYASYNFYMTKWILELSEETGGKIDLNVINERGMTPFHYICEGGNKETVKLILEFSKRSDAIDLNARSDRGRTPFHFACANREETARLILDFAKETSAIDLNASDNNGMSPFHTACNWNGSPKIAKWILDFSKENNAIDLNARDDSGRTALHWAVRNVTTDTLKLILDFSRENNGINLNARDYSGFTPFLTVCSLGKIEAVKLMLDFSEDNDKIDLNVRDPSGITAFHVACSFCKTLEMVKLIMNFTKGNRRINLNARDVNGETAFHYAFIWENKEAAKFILENWKEFGIDIKRKNKSGHTALDMLHKNDMDGRHELIPMLEEEYSKIDAYEPPSKVPKMSDDEVAKPALGPEMISDILQKTEELKNMIALYDNDPIRKNEAKTSLDKVNAIYQDLLKEKRKK